MSDPERLRELRQQQSLVRQHLDWLERAIAAETQRQGAPAPTDPGAVKVTETGGGMLDVPKPATPGPDVDSQAEAVLQEYRTAPRDLEREVRRGCALYFGAALVLLFAVIALLYFVLRH
ncbi:MAG TPA: hypothetical protein VHE61_01805 [Opitutaceae bacterium]|nr:hypothetical protein [Opitutaceae bacterium]